MYRTTLLTFADEKFEERQRYTVENIAHLFDDYKNYGPKDLEKNFIDDNIKIYSSYRGFGYWIWKPYIILDFLNNCDDDMIAVYCDAGDIIHADTLSKMKKELEHEDMMFIKGKFLHSNYTKRDCFVLMDCDDEKYWNSGQVYASALFCKKTSKTIEFLEEWQSYCKNYNVVTDAPNVCGKENIGGFIDHRHDQSILTNLVIKYSLKTREEVLASPWIIE